jgi:hypothetical protein
VFLLLRRSATIVASLLFVCAAYALVSLPALAGTTGTITGTVTDGQTGMQLAGVKVNAVSPSGSYSTTTDAKGFFSLQSVSPDTYTISYELTGYEPVNVPGLNVQQDLIARADEVLRKALKTIGGSKARGQGSLFKPYTGTDVYNVSGQQLEAATGDDDLHKTVYQYLETVPGVTPIGGAYPAEPSIRGGYDVDNGYEFDGIPITERITGYFTTNLTDLGIGNVEVYTGGLGAANAGSGLGVINTVVKTGTYPGFGLFSVGTTTPDFNFYDRLEFGTATKDRRFSLYVGYDQSASQTQFWAGNSHPLFPITEIGISSTNPGFTTTNDLIANAHYRLNDKNDFQFLVQNGSYNGDADYGISTPSNPLLELAECPGAHGGAATAGNGTGGVAPDGKPCPLGLYFNSVQNGAGNFIGHYSGIGKIQWNHTIDQHSSFALRIAENYNEYIFNQRLTDPNSPANNVPGGGTIVDPSCPSYPYAVGSPLPESAGGGQCTLDLGDYYQDRRSQEYFASLDYTLTPNPNLIVKAGLGQEYDSQTRRVDYLNEFNIPGAHTGGCYGGNDSYPCIAALSDIPTHVPEAYVSASANIGRLTLEPGLRYSRIFYGVPPSDGGAVSAQFYAPSILGTYRVGQKSAFRFSYATSGQYIGTEFVYRLNSGTYNPEINGSNAYQPQVNHVTDFQYEHEFDSNTSLKVGPYYRDTNNYLSSYQPFLGFKAGTDVPMYGDPVLSNGTKIRSLGAELGFSHLDPRVEGASVWVSGSYNNYWTQVSAVTGGQISFLGFPLPGPFLQQGIFVRGYLTPLFAGTFTADFHSHGWHFEPVAYFSYDTFYNTGGCINTDGNGNLLPYNQYSQPADCGSISDRAPVLAPESVGGGYWYLNATLSRQFNSRVTIGLNVQNVTNNQHGTTPCYNSQDPSLPVGQGSGCSGNNGPQSGTVAPVGYIYQNLTQSPRTYEAFMRIKL